MPEDLRRIVLLSGLSGAGKTTATKSLEDVGFRTIDNVLSNEHFAARDFWVEVDGVKHPGVVPKLSRTPLSIQRRAPRLGEHQCDHPLNSLDRHARRGGRAPHPRTTSAPESQCASRALRGSDGTSRHEKRTGSRRSMHFYRASPELRTIEGVK